MTVWVMSREHGEHACPREGSTRLVCYVSASTEESSRSHCALLGARSADPQTCRQGAPVSLRPLPLSSVSNLRWPGISRAADRGLERILAAWGSSRGPRGDAGSACRPSCPLPFLLSPRVSRWTEAHVRFGGRKGNSERQPEAGVAVTPPQEAGSGESVAELRLSESPCQAPLCPPPT